MTGAPGARAVDGEEFADAGRGITLCYERIGKPAATPLLLIAGLGQQLQSWPRQFCAGLAERGFCVIRFDNRDSGHSTHLAVKPPHPVAMFTRRMGSEQYHLGDMARDTVGLLDDLGYRDAHLVGASMGGMIAQTAAAHFPSRVRSLTSIMSTTGAARIGRPARKTWLMMLSPPPRTRQAAVAATVRIYRQIGSPGYPFDESWIRSAAAQAWDRDPSDAGLRRQLAAIFQSGDRTAELRGIEVPTLVIHGDRDRMVHPTGGAATAAAIKNARLETIPGMGHDLPPGTWTKIIHLIEATARRAPAEPVSTEPVSTEPVSTEPITLAGHPDTTRSDHAQTQA
jgi:pimeloyl-ACP methyl ester carboxylesterase